MNSIYIVHCGQGGPLQQGEGHDDEEAQGDLDLRLRAPSLELRSSKMIKTVVYYYPFHDIETSTNWLCPS